MKVNKRRVSKATAGSGSKGGGSDEKQEPATVKSSSTSSKYLTSKLSRGNAFGGPPPLIQVNEIPKEYEDETLTEGVITEHSLN